MTSRGLPDCEVFCRPDGRILLVYDEAIDVSVLGIPAIRRASHVEPDDGSRWWADMRPSGGAILGPFGSRSRALDAEREWLSRWLAMPHGGPSHRQP